MLRRMACLRFGGNGGPGLPCSAEGMAGPGWARLGTVGRGRAGGARGESHAHLAQCCGFKKSLEPRAAMMTHIHMRKGQGREAHYFS